MILKEYLGWYGTIVYQIIVLACTTCKGKFSPQHGLIRYLHAQCQPRRGAPRLRKFWIYFIIFLFFLKNQKNNESILKISSDSRTFGFKIFLWSKYSFDQKVEIGPFLNWPFSLKYGKYPQFLWARLLATCTTQCHRWISLEHDY